MILVIGRQFDLADDSTLATAAQCQLLSDDLASALVAFLWQPGAQIHDGCVNLTFFGPAT